MKLPSGIKLVYLYSAVIAHNMEIFQSILHINFARSKSKPHTTIWSQTGYSQLNRKQQKLSLVASEGLSQAS